MFVARRAALRLSGACGDVPPNFIPAADAVSYTTDVADFGFASCCRYLVDRPLMLLPLVASPLRLAD